MGTTFSYSLCKEPPCIFLKLGTISDVTSIGHLVKQLSLKTFLKNFSTP